MERPPLLITILTRTALFSFIWWFISDAASASWALGVPTIAAAVTISVKLAPASLWHLRWSGLFRFLPHFAWQSLRGGVDVASRVLRPSLRLAPGILDYAMRLPPGPSQIFLANSVSLLPGTLCSDIREGRMVLQVMDTAMPVFDDIKALEMRVADLFGIDMESDAAA